MTFKPSGFPCAEKCGLCTVPGNTCSFPIFNKKGASKPRLFSTPRPRGTTQQHKARRPLSGAWPSTACVVQEPEGSGGRLSKSITGCTRTSLKLSSSPLLLHGGRFSLAPQTRFRTGPPRRQPNAPDYNHARAVIQQRGQKIIKKATAGEPQAGPNGCPAVAGCPL